MSSELQEIVIGVMATLVAAFVTLPFWKRVAAKWDIALDRLRQELGEDAYVSLYNLVVDVVQAVEQNVKAGYLADSAKVMKEAALNAAVELANERGFSSFSRATIDMLIETAIANGAHKGIAWFYSDEVLEE